MKNLLFRTHEPSDYRTFGLESSHPSIYADDTIVMAEKPEQLQKALNAVSEYCSLWNLTVNSSRTTIVIFSRGKVRRYPDFVFGTEKLDVVDEYV